MCPTLAGSQTDRITECGIEMKNWQSCNLLLHLCCENVLCVYVLAEL